MNFFDLLKNLFQKQPERPENSGVLLGNQPTDYFAGVNSPIEYKIRLQDGNWTPYTWSKNLQWAYDNKGNYVDQMACVTHSMLTAIESQEFFLTGKKVKYSRRWIAKMSGTTKQGNYLYKVADTIRHYGLILEEDYPTPAKYTWNEFYEELGEKMIPLSQKGLAWLQKWNFQYEFLPVSDPNIDHHLKHSPLQVVIPGHAVCGIFSPGMITEYRDSYEPFDKDYPSNLFLAILKPILTPKTIMAREIGWQGSPELGLYLPFDSMQRRDKFRQKLSEFDADYSVDEKKTYILPAKKPIWN